MAFKNQPHKLHENSRNLTVYLNVFKTKMRTAITLR